MTPVWVPLLVALVALAGVIWTQKRADRRLERELSRVDKRAVREAERADQRAKLEAQLRDQEIRDTAQDERLFAIYVDLLAVASQIGGRTIHELDTEGAWSTANRAFLEPAMRARVLAPQAVNDAAAAFSDALTEMHPADDISDAEYTRAILAIGTAVQGLQRAIRTELGLPDLERRPSPNALNPSSTDGDS